MTTPSAPSPSCVPVREQGLLGERLGVDAAARRARAPPASPARRSSRDGARDRPRAPPRPPAGTRFPPASPSGQPASRPCWPAAGCSETGIGRVRSSSVAGCVVLLVASAPAGCPRRRRRPRWRAGGARRPRSPGACRGPRSPTRGPPCAAAPRRRSDVRGARPRRPSPAPSARRPRGSCLTASSASPRLFSSAVSASIRAARRPQPSASPRTRRARRHRPPRASRSAYSSADGPHRLRLEVGVGELLARPGARRSPRIVSAASCASVRIAAVCSPTRSSSRRTGPSARRRLRRSRASRRARRGSGRPSRLLVALAGESGSWRFGFGRRRPGPRSTSC